MPNYINKIKLPNNDVYEIQDANALPKTTQINGTSADSSTGNYTLTGDDIKLSSSYVVPSSYSAPVAGVTTLEDSIANLVKHVDDAVAGGITGVQGDANAHVSVTTNNNVATVSVASGYVIPSSTPAQAASEGTDVTLVTTGDKYTWNDKQSGITMDIGETPVTTRIADGNKNTKLVGGTAVTLTPDTTNGTITINSSDTTYSDFHGSGQDHAAGLVPDPGSTAGDSKFLCEDGSWATPPGTTYSSGTGIDIDNDTISNTGVLNVTTDNTDTDASNGTVTISKLDANGDVEEVEVAVKGLAAAAYKGVDTTITDQSTNANVPTSDVVYTYVQSAISELTGPMTFKGGAIITADSTDTTKCSIAVTNPALADNIKMGFTYKITSIAASPEYTGTLKVGDTLIADKNKPKVDATWTADTDWTVIPSGDEEGKTYPCFTYIEETEDEETVRYIGIDYGNL